MKRNLPVKIFSILISAALVLISPAGSFNARAEERLAHGLLAERDHQRIAFVADTAADQEYFRHEGIDRICQTFREIVDICINNVCRNVVAGSHAVKSDSCEPVDIR